MEVDSIFSGNYGTNLYLWGQNDNGRATSPEIPDSSRIIRMAAGGNYNIIYIGDVTSVIDTVYYPGTATLVITNPQILVWRQLLWSVRYSFKVFRIYQIQ